MPFSGFFMEMEVTAKARLRPSGDQSMLSTSPHQRPCVEQRASLCRRPSLSTVDMLYQPAGPSCFAFACTSMIVNAPFALDGALGTMSMRCKALAAEAAPPPPPPPPRCVEK